MALLGIDLGGTKLAVAIFSEEGKILFSENFFLEDREGAKIGKLITSQILRLIDLAADESTPIDSIGISVPGISHFKEGTVWAPNIPGWTNYPLLAEVKSVSGNIPVTIDSDRACYILGECWQGNARGCSDAIFLAVGTGIGAGILANGNILRGAADIAGAIGWMGLQQPFQEDYVRCGCFEYHASGEGIGNTVRELLEIENDYRGILKNKPAQDLTAHDVFEAYDNKDALATKVLQQCIKYWGMAAANLISLFNPEKIIFGGGVFGPAVVLLPAVREEAKKWAQPVSILQCSFESSALGGDAGLIGAGWLALQNK
jgi:glucokinase